MALLTNYLSSSTLPCVYILDVVQYRIEQYKDFECLLCGNLIKDVKYPLKISSILWIRATSDTFRCSSDLPTPQLQHQRLQLRSGALSHVINNTPLLTGADTAQEQQEVVPNENSGCSSRPSRLPSRPLQWRQQYTAPFRSCTDVVKGPRQHFLAMSNRQTFETLSKPLSLYVRISGLMLLFRARIAFSSSLVALYLLKNDHLPRRACYKLGLDIGRVPHVCPFHGGKRAKSLSLLFFTFPPPIVLSTVDGLAKCCLNSVSVVRLWSVGILALRMARLARIQALRISAISSVHQKTGYLSLHSLLRGMD
ncbi:hypothetical protein J6590_046277 [Homalodisca vitripennis]|nr:hypothetical protein J6590_046277 [Homalodisca vitripennis]